MTYGTLTMAERRRMLAAEKKRREKSERVGFTRKDTNECKEINLWQAGPNEWECELYPNVGTLMHGCYKARAASAEKSFVAAMKLYRTALAKE